MLSSPNLSKLLNPVTMGRVMEFMLFLHASKVLCWSNEWYGGLRGNPGEEEYGTSVKGHSVHVWGVVQFSKEMQMKAKGRPTRWKHAKCFHCLLSHTKLKGFSPPWETVHRDPSCSEGLPMWSCFSSPVREACTSPPEINSSPKSASLL